MLGNIKKIYDSLPKEYLKFLKYIPDRVLFGSKYIEWKKRVNFDKNIVNKNLFDILTYAREHTHFGKNNIPKKFYIDESENVLEELPLISSNDIATNFEYYISDEYNSFNSFKTTTGGSGRNPTTVLLSNESYIADRAHTYFMWESLGYNRVKNIKLTLRGKILKNNKLIEYNPIFNEVLVNTFKVKCDNFEDFLKELEKFKIDYIHGYPSLVKEFIEYFKKYNVNLDIKGIFFASEGSNAYEKKEISSFFNAPIISSYAQTEKVCFGIDFDMNEVYKIATSYGYPRIVDGEIVATTFINKAMPLINFRTGDGGEILEDENHMYIKNIKGRWGKDFVYLNVNKKIPTSSINLHSEIQNEILYYQIHQKNYGKIEIWLVKKETSKLDDKQLKERFFNEIKEKLEDFEIKLRLVNEKDLVRSHRGKFIFLVQDLV